jgi:hypothetical protein
MTGKRIVVHVGLHKTGTTYLQSLLRANREQLRAAQVHFPGGSDHLVQGLAVSDLMGRRPRGAANAAVTGQWAMLVESVRAESLGTVLLSDERLSLGGAGLARRLFAAFDDREAEVVVTARDLGRVLVSAWQEELRNDATHTWADFVGAVRDLENRGEPPARGFWRRQDLPAILRSWAGVVGTEHVHVVTVPPPGAGPDELTERFCRVLGLAPDVLSTPAPRTNEGLGVAATEVVRRLNARLDHRLTERQYDKVVKRMLAPDLALHSGQERFVLPADELGWVSDEARRQVAAVHAAGYPVTGDLDDLLPRPAAGRRPDDADEAEIADAALAALSALVERTASSWWAGRPDDVRVDVPRKDRWRSQLRAGGARVRSGAARLADRSAVGRRLTAARLSRQ